MYRLMIANASGMFSQSLADQLKDEFCIQICDSGSRALEMIRTFDPDILLLDLFMPGLDGLGTLRVLRSSGRSTKVIAISYSVNEFIATQLAQYDICGLLTRPCTLGAAVHQIRETLFRLENPDLGDWCLENKLDEILMTLSFHMGPSRYRCVFESVLARYHNPDSSMKELYIDVAKKCGGNYQRVEKAIRDAIEAAYEDGDHELWAMYFLPNKRRRKPYPGNEDFIARIAGCLVQMSRTRKPYSPLQKKVE